MYRNVMKYLVYCLLVIYMYLLGAGRIRLPLVIVLRAYII